MRLVVKFGDKKRYSDREYEAIYQELVAVYRALGEAIVENKPMTRKNRARVAEYLREAGAAA
jgi:hypothetical protein